MTDTMSDSVRVPRALLEAVKIKLNLMLDDIAKAQSTPGAMKYNSGTPVASLNSQIDRALAAASAAADVTDAWKRREEIERKFYEGELATRELMMPEFVWLMHELELMQEMSCHCKKCGTHTVTEDDLLAQLNGDESALASRPAMDEASDA